MRKQRSDALRRSVGSGNRNKLVKMFSQGKVVQAEKSVKRDVIFKNSYNRCLKTSKSKIDSMKMAFPYERQSWVINDMALEMLPRNQKIKPALNCGTGEWEVEEVHCDEQSTKNGSPLDFSADEACELVIKRISKDEINPSSSELKASCNSIYLSVDGEKDIESSRGFTSDSVHKTSRGLVKQSMENNNEPAEFHHLSGKRYLLILRYPSRLHFRGTLSITPIVGSTSFLGFEFSPSMKSRLVFSPKGTSPLYLQAAGNLNDGYFENIPKIPGVDKSILKRVGSRDSAILIEPASGEQWERLFGSFSSMLNFNPLIPNTRVKNYNHSELNVERNLGVEFVQPRETAVSSRLHDENSEWDHLSEAVLNAAVDQGSIRLMIFGGKGVGKSTFMRFMVNRWFSNCRRKKSGLHNFNERSVLFIDFDPGQSEFMPPGCISATLVSEPLLGPNYTHLKDPERMICIGDLNVERCPDWYLKCADELLKFCHSNPSLCQIPWFINTMGFCRGIGGDLAVKLIQLCHPTHVIQMRSRFSRRNFEPIDLLSWHSVNSWKGMEWNPSISSQNGNHVSEYFYYQLWSLAERSSVVEEDTLNGFKGATENGARGTPFQDSWEMEDIDSEWGLPAWQSRDLCIVAYFSQMVSGPRYSVLQSTPHTIKLSDLILSLSSSLLKPQMITTAFNARLVVLCNFKNSQETNVVPQNHMSEEEVCGIHDGSITERKKLPWEKVLKPNTLHHPKVLFHMPLAPCLGFGIVRAIDNNSHNLFLTTPVKDELLTSVNCLATSPSIGSLPKEIYFEPLRLDPKRKEPIPYTVICDKRTILSRTIPRVFQIPSKFLSPKV